MLSAIVPAFNEEETIGELLHQLISKGGVSEVIVVDDGSIDATAEVVDGIAAIDSRIRLIRSAGNQGKGAAVRRGLCEVSQSFVVIQDADLEYDPGDLPRLMATAIEARHQVCFGSRYLAMPPLMTPRVRRSVMDRGVRGINLVVRLLYGRTLTDEATCYKLLPTELLRSLDLKCSRFEFCPEVVAKLCRAGIEICEVPIGYSPRSRADGKKLSVTDGLQAVATLWQYRHWAPTEEVLEWVRDQETKTLPCLSESG